MRPCPTTFAQFLEVGDPENFVNIQVAVIALIYLMLCAGCTNAAAGDCLQRLPDVGQRPAD